jgi:hypothetical protein
MKTKRTITIALTATALAAGLGVAACGSQAASTAPPQVKIVHVTSPPKVTHVASPAKPAPTKTVYVTPPPATPSATAQPVAPAAPAAPPAPPAQAVNAESVVTQFYQDITDQNYQAAWALGGDNLNGGVGYGQWVAGYGTTEAISLGTFSQFGSDQVQASLSALQTDGTTTTYEGTYTVQNGVILSANIVQTS